MWRSRRRIGFAFITTLVLLLGLNGASGTVLFARAEVDDLVPADAIVVLSGEHDGREAYGLKLAEQGYAPMVLISKPAKPDDSVYRAACRKRPDIHVICRSPLPYTTRGEAIMARALAEEYGWRSIIVISWRFHLPRARKIFNECFVASARKVIMHDLPRDYPFSVAQWQYTYLYQYGGWVKAELLGPCD